MQHVEGWFRTLPNLRDQGAAEKLYREARVLPEDRRVSLMQDVSEYVWIRSAVGGDLDQAFAEWRANRK